MALDRTCLLMEICKKLRFKLTGYQREPIFSRPVYMVIESPERHSFLDEGCGGKILWQTKQEVSIIIALKPLIW
jgi:hypothetical protein